MSLWTLKEIHKALNIKKLISENLLFNGVSIDSRTIKQGDLYIPIKGEKFDGHDFIDEALKKGASASLIKFNHRKSFKINQPLIYVKDTKESLAKLASYSRQRIKKLTTICITGSSGKTTLKEWVYKIIKNSRETYSNSGNLNNDIGMPLTLVNMPKKTEVCILELGMNSPGEIKRLAKIAKPNISIITNIGSAHSGNFKKLDQIAKEKSDIFSFLDSKGIAIIPRENKYFNMILKKAKKRTKKIYSFGSSEKCQIRMQEDQRKKGFWNFRIFNKVLKIENKIFFLNWATNIALVLGLARILKIKSNNIILKIKELRPINGRGNYSKIRIQKKSIILIDESYNSSPESLIRSIKNLSNFNSKHSRRICVIGDMLELGVMSEKMHLSIVKTLEKNKPDIVITVGVFSRVIFDNLSGKFKKFHYKNYKNVLNKLLNIIKNKDIIMIKGSNSTNLHLVSKGLVSYRLG
ncbi:MAG: UDP-N-acetylmuramoyl-tripeptide--D-alanyl-D-alanine ligase [Pseudomonadota bacterium]|nr:UDP-N-acetylmuramoyl-tripeptide--D-alanyl-D-alanine ligase [Pseudomonadota bacterium]